MTNPKFGADTLLIIPCCAAKTPGGSHLQGGADPLSEFVSPQAYSAMLGARASVLKMVKGDARYLSEKYQKNGSIQEGADLDGTNPAGLYSMALSRYTGKLYSVPGFKQTVEKLIRSADSPKIIILSALYGPLHPFSEIQDYNLMMGDAPARAWNSAFPPFLEDYVRRNGIRQIILYVGSATTYFKVAKKAVRSLLDKGVIARGIQYHVENGSTPTTPLQHGLRLLDDLEPQRSEGFARSVGIVENIL